jgi:Holliday junction resolvasome RuvABC endonuclease subunit
MLLAVDIGFRKTGCVIFDKGKILHSQVIVTEKSDNKKIRKSDDYASNTAFLVSELADICDNYNIKAILVEMPHAGSKSSIAAAAMARASASIIAVATILGIPIESCSPRDVKIAVCGKASAEKKEIMAVILKKFNHPTFPKEEGLLEHICDACGVYLVLKTSNLVKMFG